LNNLGSGECYSLASKGSYVFIGKDEGVYVSTDLGNSWTLPQGQGNPYDDPYGPKEILVSNNILFAACDNWGVYRSLDNAKSWMNVNNGMSGFSQFGQFAQYKDNLFAAWGDAVYVTTNEGESWKTIGSYRDNQLFGCESLVTDGTYLYAGSYYYGIWRRPLSEITDVTEKENSLIVNEFVLKQNYPNPFNPSTTIQYGLPARSTVRLVIYNILGQVVSDLINTEQSAGWNQVVWNANVSSGLYFYRLEAASLDNPSKRFVETKKMLLLR
jgi:hypothetical protein